MHTLSQSTNAAAATPARFGTGVTREEDFETSAQIALVRAGADPLRTSASEREALGCKSPIDPAITGVAPLVGDGFEAAAKVVISQANKYGFPLSVEAKDKLLTIM
jgi:hypothetical protein